MENTYYQEMIAAQNEVETLKIKNESLLKKISEYKGVIKELRKSLSDVINEVVELSTPPKDECSCGGNCGCNG